MGGIEGALGGPRLLEASPRRRGGRVVGCLVASRGGGCARGVGWRWRCSCGRGKGEAGERAEGVLRWSHQWADLYRLRVQPALAVQRGIPLRAPG